MTWPKTVPISALAPRCVSVWSKPASGVSIGGVVMGDWQRTKGG